MKVKLTTQELRELVQPPVQVVKPFIEREHIGWLVTGDPATGQGLFVPLSEDIQGVVNRLYGEGVDALDYFEVYK